MKTSRLLIVMIAAATLWVGCEEEHPPAAAAAPAAKKATSDKPADKASATTTASGTKYVYSYNPVGKRDPFRSPVEDLHVENQGGSASCNEPLCTWDLDQLTLVAVVTGDANPIAMVEDPQGRGFVVRRNTRMGKQGGKVTNILRDSITVTEYFTGQDGRVNANPVSMKLKADSVLAPAMDLSTGQMVQ